MLCGPGQSKKKNNVEIGIFSYADPDLQAVSAHARNITMNPSGDPYVAASKAVYDIRRAHPNVKIIVALVDDRGYHVTLASGVSVSPHAAHIAQYVEGVSVVIAERDDWETGTNSAVIKNAFGQNVSILVGYKKSDHGARMALAHIELDTSGNSIISATQRTTLLAHNWNNASATYPNSSDFDTWQELVKYEANLTAALSVPIASTVKSIYGERGTAAEPWGCRWADCPMGRLVTDSFVHYMATAGFPCDVALMNAGAIRASINVDATASSATITKGDILRVTPFGNTISSVELRGSVLRQVVEHGVSEGGGRGRFLQSSGLRYSWNPTLPGCTVGDVSSDESPNSRCRVLGVEVFDHSSQRYRPLLPSRLYRMVTTVYLLNGGDGYTMLESAMALMSGPIEQIGKF